MIKIQQLIEKISQTHCAQKNELISILSNSSINDFLFKTADKVREKFVGNDVHLRGIIEFSNICKCNCKYCGLRKENLNVDRYRMSEDDIFILAKNAKKYGYKTLVLQSGEDSYFSKDKICKIIENIKKMDFVITLSLGEKTFEEYKAYKNSGADRYLLRIETTDKNLYQKLHPNMSFENRVRCLYDLKQLGYETGTGCLVGLPMQSLDSLADDILFFKKLNADMIGLGPFIPHCQTPLKDEKTGDLILSIKVLALTRLLLPDINIPATTAMETLHPDGRIFALKCGANVVMPDVTSNEFKQKYEIYPGKAILNNSPEDYKKDIVEKIEAIGRNISDGYGFHKKCL